MSERRGFNRRIYRGAHGGTKRYPHPRRMVLINIGRMWITGNVRQEIRLSQSLAFELRLFSTYFLSSTEAKSLLIKGITQADSGIDACHEEDRLI